MQSSGQLLDEFPMVINCENCGSRDRADAWRDREVMMFGWTCPKCGDVFSDFLPMPRDD